MVEQERSELAGIDAAAAGKSAGAGAGTSPSDARSSPKIKVVANLPYNITKDFLIAMLPKGEAVAELSIMIQVWCSRGGRAGIGCVQSRSSAVALAGGLGLIVGDHSRVPAQSSAWWQCYRPGGWAWHDCTPASGLSLGSSVPGCCWPAGILGIRQGIPACMLGMHICMYARHRQRLTYFPACLLGLQEEAAQRLVDPTPKRPDYRSMNVRVNFYSQPVYR
eukprot:363419-Chlamydomonas_euryale.AAC.8